MTDEEYESFKFFDFDSEVNDVIDGVHCICEDFGRCKHLHAFDVH